MPSISAQVKDIEKKITELQEEIRTIPRSVKLIMENAKQEAQAAIYASAQSDDFNQKYGGSIANSLVVEESSGSVSLEVDEPEGTDLYWNLYFAEHGAGMESDGNTGGYVPKHSPPSSWWTYVDFSGQRHTINTAMKVGYLQHHAIPAVRDGIEKLKEAQRQHKKFTL